jgi:hypothetical protein
MMRIETEEQPLGVMSEIVWLRHRAINLSQAIERYMNWTDATLKDHELVADWTRQIGVVNAQIQAIKGSKMLSGTLTSNPDTDSP